MTKSELISLVPNKPYRMPCCRECMGKAKKDCDDNPLNCFDFYLLNKNTIDKLKEKPNILKPCPFCGGEAEIKPTTIYTEKGLCVHCKDCNIHTTSTMYECKYNQFEGKKDVYVTKEMAEKHVTKKWNRRSDNVT